MTDFKQFSMYDNVPVKVVGTMSSKYRRRVYVVWCECGSIDVYGHPIQWLLGVFKTKNDAVLALEGMSGDWRIACWGCGRSRWRLIKKSPDDNTEFPVTANDMVEWGVIPRDEVSWDREDPEFFIEELPMGALKSLMLVA